jgi:SulP family sulfate permease
VQLHLSEIKGPVMDQLKRSNFLQHFGGQVFISQFQALRVLDPNIALETLKQEPHTLYPPIKSEGKNL